MGRGIFKVCYCANLDSCNSLARGALGREVSGWGNRVEAYDRVPFKGILKGVYKVSVVGFYGKGA